MSKLLEQKKLHLLVCCLFSILAVAWVILSNPMFPVSSLYPVEMPYRFPILGFVIPCWLLYFGFKQITLLWLLLVVPSMLAFNLHMLRPDSYFLWLCLFVISISDNKEQAYMGFLFILGGMYLWTAIQKSHIDFVVNMAQVFDKRILSGSLPKEVSITMAGAIPMLELTMAFLCFSRWIKIRIVLATLLHGGILFFLIKGGWNHTMIVWNLLLIVFHWLLPAFQRQSNTSWKWYITPIIVMVFPALYFIGYWPGFASWTMYSGRIDHYRRTIDKETALYPPSYINGSVYLKNGEYSVSVTEWADAETGGAPCMEPIFKEKILNDCKSYIETHP